MTHEQLVQFIREQPWAVQATVSAIRGGPQAAVIGVVVTDRLELFFDTFRTSRKYVNLKKDPRIALVIGWDDAQTVQYEGRVDEPQGSELAALKDLYFTRFPDGRQREASPDVAYFRVRPHWVRYSDFRGPTPHIVELSEPRVAVPLV